VLPASARLLQQAPGRARQRGRRQLSNTAHAQLRVSRTSAACEQPSSMPAAYSCGRAGAPSGGGGARGQQHWQGARPAQRSVSSSTLLATSAAPTTPPAGRRAGRLSSRALGLLSRLVGATSPADLRPGVPAPCGYRVWDRLRGAQR